MVAMVPDTDWTARVTAEDPTPIQDMLAMLTPRVSTGWTVTVEGWPSVSLTNRVVITSLSG